MHETQAFIQPFCETTEADVGINQFIMLQQNNEIQRSDLYYACRSESLKGQTDEKLRTWIKAHYPGSILQIVDAPNALTGLFVQNTPWLEARFKPIEDGSSGKAYQGLEKILASVTVSAASTVSASPGPGMITEPNMDITLDYDKMALYGVQRSTIEDKLQQLFGTYLVSELSRFGASNSIVLKEKETNLEAALAITIPGRNGSQFPLQEFLTTNISLRPKFISSDKAGDYRSIIFGNSVKDVGRLQDSLTKLARQAGLSVEFTGRYFDDRRQIGQLWLIFGIVLFLLYVILAFQYEDLVLPLIVMLTIPLGITGGTLLLWLTGGTLNVMTAIGFIVILGLIVDDPILKVEVLHRIARDYRARGYANNDEMLEKMIHEAGDICLKPLLLVSLTTSIAMVPVIVVGGIGNDLQKPMAYVIMGGLTLGTFFTTWFIPLAFWYISKWRKQ
jgi:multidrug efflux pump subunit AcrB